MILNTLSALPRIVAQGKFQLLTPIWIMVKFEHDGQPTFQLQFSTAKQFLHSSNWQSISAASVTIRNRTAALFVRKLVHSVSSLITRNKFPQKEQD